MKIDTNLHLEPQTHVDTNLSIDKDAILRPKPKPQSKPQQKTAQIPIPKSIQPKPQPQVKQQQVVTPQSLAKAFQMLFTGSNDQPKSTNEILPQPISGQNIRLPRPPINLPVSLDEIIRTCISKRYKAELWYDGGQRVVEIYCYVHFF